MSFRRPFLAFLLAVPASFPALAGIDARILQQPDVSQDRIVFVYAGDLWVVPKEGGTAHHLSTPAGQEEFPRFSPDGSRVAFGANYDGNTDLYVMDAMGGLPRRLTHHPAADRLLDWYPDGKSVLFATSMTSGTNRFNQLYRTSPEGGLPERLPVPYGEFGRISPDGRTLAYLPITLDFRTWKRYRGGMAPDIWLFDLKTYESRNVTESDANDTQPMWHGSTLYFLSDRDANFRANIWALDTPGGRPRQVTHFEDYDATFPSIGPEEIVFANGADLYLLDLKTEKTRRVEIEVVTDRATLKPRLEKVASLRQWTGPSPSAKRIATEARGELFTVPAEHGATINLTRSPGVAERYPAWSPDGKLVAYFTDRTGEYELAVRPADGTGEERRLTSLGPGFRYRPQWSPDSKRIVFADQAMRIHLFDVEKEKLTTVDRGVYMFHGPLSGFRVAWSADSRWFAYSRDVESRSSVVFLYDCKEGKLHRLTSGFYNDTDPEFDAEGKYLYYLTGRTFDPIYSDLDNTWIYANTTVIAAVPLKQGTASPLPTRNDQEGEPAKDEAKKDDEDKESKDGDGVGDKEKDQEKKDGDKKPEPKPVEIDVEGFEERIVLLPPKSGNYDQLRAVAGKVLYRRLPRTGSGIEDSPLVYFDFEAREEKTILDDADAFEITADGKKVLVLKDKDFSFIEIKEKQKLEKKLDLSGMEMNVDPAAEWRQIFNDAWRFERDYFYDPRLHGVDWEEMRRRYGAILDHAVTRWDVNFVIGELIAELNASHAYRGGGDTQKSPEVGVGLLGADFSLENGAYRITRILSGAPWDAEARSPLSVPGIDARQGEYLLAVNGMPLDTTKDPWAALQGVADRAVLLTLGEKPSLKEKTRQVVVHTLNAEKEFRLRNLAWIEERRQMVDKASKGRIGYVYVPSTGINGQNELVRMFRGQADRDGLIIDERFNSGGQIPDRFVELLNRPLTNYWGVRDGRDWMWPPVTHVGPKAMLINGWSGSGGDALPFYFKQAGLGPLIGMRTWGGLIGISGAPPLIDGGGVTVPTFGMYSLEGKWIIEGYGVDPDIEVVDDPAELAKGGDPQLERAVGEVLDMLRKSPPREPGRPAYPLRAAP